MIIEILFWFSALALLHSYVIFPWSLELLALGKKRAPENPQQAFSPLVSVLMPAYNEEAVLAQKLQSIFRSDYENLELIVGSDASTDGTNHILLEAQKQNAKLKTRIFPHRTGKPGVVNALAEEAKGEILILTDANVMFDKQTISKLVLNFTDKRIGLVDGVMVNEKTSSSGISIPESRYMTREIRVKHLESKLWGTMMGPFGGCFAIRAELFSEVPANFIADDFYQAMRVFEQGYKAINELGAKAYENVSDSLWEEYRRKVRISAGNFQNLMRFAKLLLSPVKGISYCFTSHKLIRWLGPFLLILLYFCSWMLSGRNEVWNNGFYFLSTLFLLPVLDLVLQRFGVHLTIFRYLTHFFIMNLALLVGFLKFVKGISSNVWQPTKRLQ